MLGTFLIIALTSAFIGGSITIALKERHHHHSRREKMMVVMTLWFCMPCVAALPFYLSNYIPNAIDAIFEATSGLTTTGSTLIGDLSSYPESLKFWRSFLQWLGGLATLSTISVFLSPLTGNSKLHSYLLVHNEKAEKSDLQFLSTLKIIFPIYLVLTLSCFILLLFCNIQIMDAILLSFAAVSTGGFMPRDGGLMLYGSYFLLLILTVFMILGALNIFWVGRIIKGREMFAYHTREAVWIVGVIVILCLYIYFFAVNSYNSHASIGWFEPFVLSLTKASSLVTTTGFVADQNGMENIPIIVLFLVVLVGGGRFSSAGGLKASRLIAMFHQSSRELKTLIYPHIVRKVRFGHEELDTHIITSIWSLFTATIFLICFVALMLSFYGMNVEDAFLASITALSNAGPVFEQIKSSTDNQPWIWLQVADPAKIIIAFTMILGRLEIVVVLSLFNLRFWRH